MTRESDAYQQADWCLTCEAHSGPNHNSEHDVVCVPTRGWGACRCRYCLEAMLQMSQSTDEASS